MKKGKVCVIPGVGSGRIGINRERVALPDGLVKKKKKRCGSTKSMPSAGLDTGTNRRKGQGNGAKPSRIVSHLAP